MTSQERLKLDVERVDRHRLAMSTSGKPNVFDDEIRPDVWDYANRTLPALIASGEVFAIRSSRGAITTSDLVMPADGIPFAAAEDLAADTIAKALDSFEKKVRLDWNGHRSNPATLGTYFIGLCSLVFPGPYRRWSRHNRRLATSDVSLENALGATKVWEQPEAVIYDIEFERHLELINDPIEEAIVRYDVDGATNKKIAEVLDITESVVEYRLKKTRAAGQARWRQENDDFRESGRLTA